MRGGRGRAPMSKMSATGREMSPGMILFTKFSHKGRVLNRIGHTGRS